MHKQANTNAQANVPVIMQSVPKHVPINQKKVHVATKQKLRQVAVLLTKAKVKLLIQNQFNQKPVVQIL